jgi:hypothetical protein
MPHQMRASGTVRRELRAQLPGRLTTGSACHYTPSVLTTVNTSERQENKVLPSMLASLTASMMNQKRGNPKLIQPILIPL